MKLVAALTLAFGLLVSVQAQSPLNGNVYGLEFSPSQLKLASVNPGNGQVAVISPNPTSADQFGSGISDLDPINDLYYYVRFGQIITVDLNTGLVVNSPSITCSSHNFNVIQPISNIAFNWLDGNIYGLLHFGSQLWFATVDPITGIMTVLSNGPVSGDLYASGVSDIDPIGGRYFYTRNGRIVTIDIATATVSSSVAMNNPNNATAAITNIAYDWLSDQIYGLNYVGAVYGNSSWLPISPAELRLATVDPVSGFVNIISPQVLSADQFQSGVSDIDPVAGNYYYIRNGRILTVDLGSGTILHNNMLQTSTTNTVTPITNIAVHKDLNSVPAPIAVFADTHHDLLVQFTNTSSYALHSHWDFGDGHTSNDRHPEHTFAAPGVYFVELTVENADGSIAKVTEMIDVEEAEEENPFELTVWEPINFLDDTTEVTDDNQDPQDPVQSTGLNELDETRFSLFPNPAATEFTIQLEGISTAQLLVYDMLGNQVLVRNVQNGNTSVDVSPWATGQYLYRVMDRETAVKSGRLVVGR